MGPIATPSATGVGLVYEIKKGLRKRMAVALNHGPEGWTLLYSDTKTLVTPASELPPPSWPLPVPQPTGRTEAWVLMALALARRAGQLDVNWSADSLQAAALECVAGDWGATRSLALDAFDTGSVEVLSMLGLPETEKTWLIACCLDRLGNGAESLEKVLALPPTRYPGKIAIIARQIGLVFADPKLIERVRPHLAAFAETDVTAHALLNGLPNSSSDTPTVLADIDAILRVLPETSEYKPAFKSLRALLDNEIADPPVTYPGAMSRALVAHKMRDRPGDTRPAVPAGIVPYLPWPVAEDLIAASVFDVDELLSINSGEDLERRLRSRVAPEELSNEDLVTLGHDWELARRLYVVHDLDELQALPDSPPKAHFLALHELRAGRKEVATTDLRSSDASDAEALLEYLASPAAETVIPERLYRDRTIWPAVATHLGSGATPQLPDGADAAVFLGWCSLWRARELLFLGDWGGAEQAAKACLGQLEQEDHRDEALNVLACAHYQQGHDDAAIAALEKALEGDYSESLQANIGICAAELAPEVATRHLGRLVQEAPTTALKLAAARRAFGLWANSPNWTEGIVDDDETRTMPVVLRDPLRWLVAQDIPLDDFREIIGALAINDSVWVAQSLDLSSSPNRSSLEADFFVNMARGGDDRTEALVRATRTAPDADWVISERDSFVNALVSLMIDSLDSEEGPAIGIAFLAFKFIDDGAVIPPYDHVRLVALATGVFCIGLNTNDGEPTDLVRNRLERAKQLIGQVDAEDQELLRGLINNAYERLAIATAAHREHVLNIFSADYNDTLARLRRTPDQNINWIAVARSLQPALDYCQETRSVLNNLITFVDDADLHAAVASVIDGSRELEGLIRRLLS